MLDPADFPRRLHGRHSAPTEPFLCHKYAWLIDLTNKDITGKEVRSNNQIYLQHGKPMIFGEEGDKGIRMVGNRPEVVTIGENGITEDDLLVHNAKDGNDDTHYMLVRMGLPEFPVAMGVIRAAESTVFESMLHDQVVHAQETAEIKSMDDLLRSGNVFEIND